jgi:hypothetical protein
MRMIEYAVKSRRHGRFLALLSVLLNGCGISPQINGDGRVYHCVASAMPFLPPDVSPKKQPLERFEYGDYVRTDRVSTGRDTYCNFLRVPDTAYLRYRYEGNVIEKRFDLSVLSARRVYDKRVEFYIDGEIVEVRLVTPVRGNFPIRELILRQ